MIAMNLVLSLKSDIYFPFLLLLFCIVYITMPSISVQSVHNEHISIFIDIEIVKQTGEIYLKLVSHILAG